MAAGSVAAGGLYMQSEFNQLKNKRLQEFGLQVQTVRAAEGWKRMLQKKGSKEKLLPNRKKVRKLREQYATQTNRRRNNRAGGIEKRSISNIPERKSRSASAISFLSISPPRPPSFSNLEEPEPSSEDSRSWREEDEIFTDQNGGLDEGIGHSDSSDSFLGAGNDVTRSSDNAEIINVSGTQFLVDFSVFAPYPDTLLGSSRMNKYYMSSREEYFLERQKHVFNSVIRFYTNDEELICPPCIPKHVFEAELEFYGLTAYYHKLNTAPVADLKDYKAKTRREEILLHIEFPGYSKLATAYAIFDLIIIIISTIVLVLESVKDFEKHVLFETICLGIEIAVNVYFTIQTLVLITVYPSRKLYFSSVTNWIDIISILPFYLKLIAGDYLEQVGGFRVLRLIRLLRILKLFRHSPGSQTMIHFLMTSIPEIVLLLLMWSIGVLMFGPLIYFVEKPGTSSTAACDSGNLSMCSNFSSAFSGMWFCVVTIGTVGYGDMVPQTEYGKVLAAMYTIVNLTIMTIPISIIITKFNKSMKKISS